MPQQYYPPSSFYFKVLFDNFGEDQLNIDFQSVSGLDAQFETETFKEGGENRFEHVMPVRTKFSDLILKRGIVRPESSQVTDWCISALINYQIEPKNLEVYLLNDKGNPMMYWKIIHAWPKNWKIGEMNAEKSEVFIETLELNYNRYEFKKGV